MFEEQ